MFEFKENSCNQSPRCSNHTQPSRFTHCPDIYEKTKEGKDVLYLKQIFLKASDFVEWAKEETKDYKIINIINI